MSRCVPRTFSCRARLNRERERNNSGSAGTDILKLHVVLVNYSLLFQAKNERKSVSEEEKWLGGHFNEMQEEQYVFICAIFKLSTAGTNSNLGGGFAQPSEWEEKILFNLL